MNNSYRIYTTSDGKTHASVLDNKSGEPATKVGAFFSALVAITGLLNVFLPDLLSDTQFGLIYYVVAMFIPLVTALFTRRFVWSPKSVKEVLEEGIAVAEETKGTGLSKFKDV